MISRAAKYAAKANAALKQKRNLSIHEYQSMQLLNSYDIATPKSVAAHTAEDAQKAALTLGTNKLVIKAQVLAGGRGKGHFDSGFQGGVHLYDDPSKTQEMASQMIGHNLITKQTGAAGRMCSAVMLAEQCKPKHEYYLAVLNDRTSQGPVIVASSQGGMNIEDVAHNTPEAIITTHIDIKEGVRPSVALALAKELGFSTPETQKQAADTMQKLYKIFIEKDATQIEINPLSETVDGRVLCMDAKFGFDDNAEFRQKDIFALRDTTQEDPSEIEAAEYGLNFIKLDGNIGCLVNGAGLAMATMDVLKLNGGSPANFLDVGGGATAAAVKKAFEILLREKAVSAIFVNIFGGIMRCDIIAEGIIQATRELSLTIPLIVRLQGSKEAEAKKLIQESGLKIASFDGLDDGAKAAVEAAGKYSA